MLTRGGPRDTRDDYILGLDEAVHGNGDSTRAISLPLLLVMALLHYIV